MKTVNRDKMVVISGIFYGNLAEDSQWFHLNKGVQQYISVSVLQVREICLLSLPDDVQLLCLMLFLSNDYWFRLLLKTKKRKQLI